MSAVFTALTLAIIGQILMKIGKCWNRGLIDCTCVLGDSFALSEERGSEGLGFVPGVCAGSFILGKDNLIPFPHSTQV